MRLSYFVSGYGREVGVTSQNLQHDESTTALSVPDPRLGTTGHQQGEIEMVYGIHLTSKIPSRNTAIKVLSSLTR